MNTEPTVKKTAYGFCTSENGAKPSEIQSDLINNLRAEIMSLIINKMAIYAAVLDGKHDAVEIALSAAFSAQRELVSKITHTRGGTAAEAIDLLDRFHRMSKASVTAAFAEKET